MIKELVHEPIFPSEKVGDGNKRRFAGSAGFIGHTDC